MMAAIVLDRGHRVDVGVDVQLELEIIPQQLLQLHHVEEDRAVLYRADKDRHAKAVAGGQEGGLPDAQRLLELRHRAAEEIVKLRGSHAALELRSSNDRGKQAVGVEQGLLGKAEVVDSNDPRQAERQVPGVGVYLANRVADHPVRVVIKVGSGGRQRRDDAPLD